MIRSRPEFPIETIDQPRDRVRFGCFFLAGSVLSGRVRRPASDEVVVSGSSRAPRYCWFPDPARGEGSAWVADLVRLVETCGLCGCLVDFDVVVVRVFERCELAEPDAVWCCDLGSNPDAVRRDATDDFETGAGVRAAEREAVSRRSLPADRRVSVLRAVGRVGSLVFAVTVFCRGTWTSAEELTLRRASGFNARSTVVAPWR